MNFSQRKEQWTGVALVAFAALIWGWQSPMMKGLYSEGVDVLSLIFLRTLFCMATAAAFFFWYDKTIFRITPKQFGFLFVYGIVVVAGTGIGFFLSLKYLSVSSGLLLHYTFPILTMLGSVLMLREKPSLFQIASAFLILLGVGMGVMSSGESQGVSVPGILWGLLAVVGISLQTLLGRMASKTVFIPQGTLLFYGFVGSAFTIAFCKYYTSGWGDIAALTPYNWATIFFLGAAGTFVPQMFYFIALRKITAPLGSLVSSFELVAAMTFAALMLNEIPTMPEVVGSAVVILAIAVASYTPSTP